MGSAYKSLEREITMLTYRNYLYGDKKVFYHTDTSEDYIGCFELSNSIDHFTIWNLMIRERHRCKGNAERMLREFIEQFNFSKPLVLYVLKANKIAIHLYEKVGFKIIGDYGVEAYEMLYVA